MGSKKQTFPDNLEILIKKRAVREERERAIREEARRARKATAERVMTAAADLFRDVAQRFPAELEFRDQRTPGATMQKVLLVWKPRPDETIVVTANGDDGRLAVELRGEDRSWPGTPGKNGAVSAKLRKEIRRLVKG